MSIAQYFFLVPLILTGLIVYYSFKGVNINKEENTLIRDWNSRAKWQGSIAEASVVNWKQLNVMCNFDYFYLFTIEFSIDGQKKLSQAVGVIPVSQTKLIKKGAKVIIKYQLPLQKKITVESVIDPDS